MTEIIETAVYVLGDNIDTDQIIPAQYLAISLSDDKERARYGGLALLGVPRESAGLPDGFVRFSDPATNETPYKIIVAGKNFGCGSSREHAPVALAEAGVRAIIARSYARIFFRNAVDGGYFPPYECALDLANKMKTGDKVRLSKETGILTHLLSGNAFTLNSLGAAKDIVECGGIFAYARKHGLEGIRTP